ncbi:MAG: Undecaprenyl-phosphate mannosyltransferase [Verrucomicrobia subdivision 3 bacterium]|nr:Undecaprenyl-phosphate mannosyltransferase [Limisphaerales bacterium]MCS1414594.1 Undecaprenyl-phosphate mannosyltransferase [Limisphaerales bacterium]
MKSKAVAVVPTYNERDNIKSVVDCLLSSSGDVDVLVVDDNSPDGTGKFADELAKKHAEVNVLHRKKKDGLGRAYCDGFSWALERSYEFMLEMDGDFSHDPKDIPKFLEAAQEADLVIGSRYRDGIRVINWPLNRLVLSLCAAKYVQIITGMPFTDPTGGFKCFRRSALEIIDLDRVRSNGYSFQIELTHQVWRRGLKVSEVPIIFTDRFQGSSKMSPAIIREALVIVWQLWFRNGFRRKPSTNSGSILT